jgi:hypothetical protein
MFNYSEQQIHETKEEIAAVLSDGYHEYRSSLLGLADSDNLLKSYKVIIEEYLIKLKRLKEEFQDKLEAEEHDLIDFVKRI